LMSCEVDHELMSIKTWFRGILAYLAVNIHHRSVPDSSSPVLHSSYIVGSEPSSECRIMRRVVLKIYRMKVGGIGSSENEVDHGLWLYGIGYQSVSYLRRLSMSTHRIGIIAILPKHTASICNRPSNIPKSSYDVLQKFTRFICDRDLLIPSKAIGKPDCWNFSCSTERVCKVGALSLQW
jgi:hypothetical protein